MESLPHSIHPLNQLYRLIEENHIATLYNEFWDFDSFYSSFDPTVFDDAIMIRTSIGYEVKSGEKTLNFFNFDDHIKGYLDEYTRSFKEAVRNFVLDKPEKVTIDYTKLLQKEILQLIICAEKKNIIAMTQIMKSLRILNDFLTSYSKSTIFPLENTNSTQSKIKWLGKVNELATLFHDLSQGTNNLKRVFIENNRQELKQFIFDNFIDSEGKQFNEETVYRILDPNKSDTKKSKDRFSLSDNLSDL